MKTWCCRGTFRMARLTGQTWQSHVTCCSQQPVQRHAHHHQLNAASDHLGWAQGSGLYKRAVFWQIIISLSLREHETEENRCKQSTSTLLYSSAFTCTLKTRIQEIVSADGVFELNTLYLNYFNINLIRLIIIKCPIASIVSLTYTERGMSALKIIKVTNSYKCSWCKAMDPCRISRVLRSGSHHSWGNFYWWMETTTNII